MAIAMEDADFGHFVSEFELDFSGCSTITTTTTTEDEGACNWNDWSPVVDWDAITGEADDFRELIESMMVENELDPVGEADDFRELIESMMVENELDPVGYPCKSGDSSNSTVMPMMVEEELVNGGSGGGNVDEDLKGLRLVHLLMAAAEALTGAGKTRELARVILVRLKELVSPSNGTNMERLAAYFTEALQGLLDGAGAHTKHHHPIGSGGAHRDDQQAINPTDVLAAFQLVQDMSPYVKFGHFTANQAILESVVHDRRVHIVDYDIMEGIQWASLMQALVSRKEGPPAPHLRITAITRCGNARKSFGSVQETGRRLIAFAASIELPFSFHQCKLDPNESFRLSNLKLVKGEALVINCVLQFPHSCYRAPEGVASFLSGAKTLNPRIITLVEEEVGPIEGAGFVGRFMDSLHHYSAVYDSLEAGFPMQSWSRALVERVFIGPRIAGTMARIYRARGEEDEWCSWGEWMAGAGFGPVGISFFNHCQAKLLLGLFNDGYRVEELGSNKLVLGWKSRRLLSASIWSAPSPPQDSDLTS